MSVQTARRPRQNLAGWIADAAILVVGMLLLPFVVLLIGAPFVLLLKAIEALVGLF